MTEMFTGTSTETYEVLGVVVAPEDDERLGRELADITRAERRAERETEGLRFY